MVNDNSAGWDYPPTPLVAMLSNFPAGWVYPPTPPVAMLSNFPAGWVYPPTPLKGGYVVDYFEYRTLNFIQIFKYLLIREPQDFYAEFLNFIRSAFVIFPRFSA